MEWFGWLAKGSCHISLLDVIIFIMELATLLGVGILFIEYVYFLIKIIKKER